MRVSHLAVLGILALAGCTTPPAEQAQSGSPRAGSSAVASSGSPSASTAIAGCRSDYAPAPLPEWARAGFTPPTTPVPYVLGDEGDIVAILWAEHDPLRVPPLPDRNNKITWVSRVGSGDLDIRATLESSRETVTRSVPGGPGPSVIDLRSPGCWSFDLTWGTRRDHLQLEYVTG